MTGVVTLVGTGPVDIFQYYIMFWLSNWMIRGPVKEAEPNIGSIQAYQEILTFGSFQEEVNLK